VLLFGIIPLVIGLMLCGVRQGSVLSPLLFSIYRVGQKKRGHGLMTIILSVPNRFKNFFSLKDSLVILQLKRYQTFHMLLHLVKH